MTFILTWIGRGRPARGEAVRVIRTFLRHLERLDASREVRR